MVSPFWRATEHGQGRELSRNYSMTGSRLLLRTCLQLENMRSCCENRRTADPQERLKAFFVCWRSWINLSFCLSVGSESVYSRYGDFSLSSEFTDKLLAYRSSFMSSSFQADKMLKSIYTDVTEGVFEGGLLRCCSIRVDHFTYSDCEVET